VTTGVLDREREGEDTTEVVASRKVTREKQYPHLKPYQWQPGQSGNPSGRLSVPADLKRILNEHTPQALEVIRKLMLGAVDERVKLQAAQTWLDRAWGKPIQQVDATLSALSPDEREAKRAELEQLAAERLRLVAVDVDCPALPEPTDTMGSDESPDAA